MFDIKTTEVEIEGQQYKLRPLTGRFLPKFYSVLSKFQGVTEETESNEILSKLDEPTIEKLHELILETLKATYKDIDDVKLEEFVSQHLITFLPHILSINLPPTE